MSASDSIFKPLSNLPLKCRYYNRKPSFYPKHSTSIIISTDFEETNAGVFKYDLENNNLELLQRYSDIEPEFHGQFIDYNNDTLHILSPKDSLHVTMDLKTKIIKKKQKFLCGDFPKCVEIATTHRHEIHIISDFDEHSKFDCKTKDLVRVNSNNDELNGPYDCKLLYIESKEQLMILGGQCDGCIYYCNIKEPNQWKLMSNLKMPHNVVASRYDILVYYDVIIVFYFDGTKDIYNIWCLDLLDYKWYESKYNVPESVGTGVHFIKCNHNHDIHLLDFDCQLHFKVNIYNLFSNAMIKERREYYEILVIGFVKDQEKKIILNVPWAIKKLILFFYPLFGKY